MFPPCPHSCMYLVQSVPPFPQILSPFLKNSFFPSFFLFSFSFSPFGPNHSTENVKPAVLGMLPKETVLLKILFLPKYFQSSWRAVKPQWLSAAFPSSISPGSPSTALSNWILFEEEGKKCCTRQFVDLRIILWVLKARDPEVLSCQTPGPRDCVIPRCSFQQGDIEETCWQWSIFRLSFQSLQIVFCLSHVTLNKWIYSHRKKNY